MVFKNTFKDKIFFDNLENFDQLALELYYFQSENNLLYQKYQQYLGIDYQTVCHINQIPFLPIEFFKTQKVITTKFDPQATFQSSGTTGKKRSKHFISDIDVYRESILKGFKIFFNEVTDYIFISLLPSYSELNNSSLAFMANELIVSSKNKFSGFYLDNYKILFDLLKELIVDEKKIFILGLSSALMDFAKIYSLDLNNAVIMETGGMKGSKKEIPREEFHKILCERFNKKNIQSEYGMTELLSQAYSYKDGIFKSVPWMQVMIRDIHDPFKFNKVGDAGAINVIDLANIYSCAFIETQDLGLQINDTEFMILGRTDSSELRGCNLLIS